MDHPVVNVSWNDATAFCQWLSQKEGKTYRLPTEAEWEYACRAGSQSRYWFGSDPEDLARYGNVSDASAKSAFTWWEHGIKSDDGFIFTAPVGRFPANPWGLHDMHGNVNEWCQDWYAEDYYAQFRTQIAVDPVGPSSGTNRVLRGGSWYLYPWFARSAYRGWLTPDLHNISFGFRVVSSGIGVMTP